jgi:demethylmenaquinone methyltransferase/2-methoxy-6-polyprenyl-1,4-benzoquinol methylase
MGTDDQSKQYKEGLITYLTLGDPANLLTEPAIRSAIQALHLPSGSRGLDAGCGVGNHSLWLAEAVSPGGHVTGVDISDECLAVAEEKANKSRVRDQVSFQNGDIWNLPFEDDSFDWVWCADVLALWFLRSGSVEEVAGPVMKEFARVVKPGGIVAIVFWASQRLLPGYPLLESRLMATNAANFVGPHGIRPELHTSRTLGWFQHGGLKEPKVETFVLDLYAPFDEDTKRTLVGIFKMFWAEAKPEVSAEDWEEYRRLCELESPDFILNLPDYHGFITYSLFYARVD